MIDFNSPSNYPLKFDIPDSLKEERLDTIVYVNKFYFSDNKKRFYGVNFGKALRTLRNDIDLLSGALSLESGVSQSYISQLENDVRLPSDKIVTKLSKGFTSYLLSEQNLDKEKYKGIPWAKVVYDEDIIVILERQYQQLFDYCIEQNKKIEFDRRERQYTSSRCY